MVDNLESETIRGRLQAFLDEVIDAKGPKTVARDLTSLGWEYSEGAVRAWRGSRKPPADVLFALAALYEVSMDLYATGAALEVKLTDQLVILARRMTDLEDRLHAWEIEAAAAAGLEPPPSFAESGGGTLNLADAAVRRRLDDLEREVSRLQKQA